MKLIRLNDQITVLGTNAAMKLLLDQSKREQLAEFIVHGNGRVFTRGEIKLRIQKVCRRLALKILEG